MLKYCVKLRFSIYLIIYDDTQFLLSQITEIKIACLVIIWHDYRGETLY